ncbi:MAG: VCBS repeat-containing protein [Chryseolinea sp.]
MREVAKAILFFCLVASCSPESDTLFSKLGEGETGIDFVNTNRETELSNVLTYEYFYNGGGVALGDVNNDGLVDIYFTSNIFSNKLYLNEGNFKFKDITEQSGTACEVGWKTGVTMVDINNDGLLDIYVCRSASPDKERRRNILLINNGDLTFTDKAKEYNLDDASYSTQAAFFDFDKDDDLDMMLLNHSLLEISNVYNLSVKNSDKRFPDVGNRLYRNDNGHFTDISDTTGVYGSAFNYGLGISLSDVNNDGWIDMYIGCDYTGRDKLLTNDHGKFFNDVTGEQLSHISKFTMGTDMADIDGDQNMDIITLDMLPEDNFRQKQLMGSDRYDVFNSMVKSGLHSQYMRNMLHLNNGNGTFSEIGQLAGISNTDWSWSALIQDYDNDGIQDIFISNGFKRDLTNNDFAKFEAAKQIESSRKDGKKISSLEVIDKFEENKIPNYSYKGNGDLTFSNATKTWGFDEPFITNGVAYADLDNDGDLDLVTNNMNDEAGIYRNNSERYENNFLSVKLAGKVNRFAIGSRVTVFADGKKLVKEVFPVRGFQSSVDYTLNFGLGKIARVDSVAVQWPAGGMSVVREVSINQILNVKEGESITINNNVEKEAQLFSKIEALDFKHEENQFNDFDVQRLLPQMYSTAGPALACGDVNKDGLPDVFIGGAKDHLSELFIQNKKNQFVIKPQKSFAVLSGAEVVDAVFFDMDKDGDEDFYVVTGGYEFQSNDKALRDHLFENVGGGNFAIKNLPELISSGSCVRPNDMDQDGDIDLFVGARLVPGKYPEIPESYILINDSKGNFLPDTVISKPIRNVGMVTDAHWVDLNKDNFLDLVIVGEWMPLKVFLNKNGQLIDQSSEFVAGHTEGFWNTIVANDFDKDGDIDLVAGNYGMNNQMKPSTDHPIEMYYADYDNNGSVDPILEYFILDNSYPYATRDELAEQLPSFKKRFVNYKSYANAKINAVLNAEEIKKSSVLKAYTFKTCLFRNDAGKFIAEPLPVEFQFAPVYSMLTNDVNGDGNMDIVAGGNLTATRARTGKLTGNCGIVALNDGKGKFKVLKSSQSGLNLNGDVRHLIMFNDILMAGINNQHVIAYRMRK